MKTPPDFSLISFKNIHESMIYLNDTLGIDDLTLKSLNPCAKIKTLDFTIWRRGFYVLSVWDRKMIECYLQTVIWVKCLKCDNIVIPNFSIVGEEPKTFAYCPICHYSLNRKSDISGISKIKKISKIVFDFITTNNCFQCFHFKYDDAIKNMGFCQKKRFQIPIEDALKIRVCEKVKTK